MRGIGERIRLLKVGFAEHEAADSGGAAGGFVDVDDRAAEADIAGGHVEGGGDEGHGRFQDAIDLAAEDAVVGAGHADVALEGGAAGEDALVGGGNMSMGAEDRTNAAVEIAAHQLFIAGGFGVEIDKRMIFVSEGIAARIRSAALKGQSTGCMKTRPSRLNTATGNAIAGVGDGESCAGGFFRVIGRLDDIRFVSQDIDTLRCGGRCDRRA